MKKVISFLFLLFVLFYLSSCDNSFSPYAPFTKDYILNGIIRGDTSYQVVTLTHSYQPNNSDPLSYKTDPAIVGAQVELTYDNKVYVLRDSSISRTDTLHYDSPFKFYYTDSLKPGANKTISIKAILPDGKILKADTKTPNVGKYDFDFFDIRSATNIPPPKGSLVDIYWESLGNFVYVPDININYQVTGDSGSYKIALPLSYDKNETPVYAKPTRDNYLSFNLSTVNKTLNELAQKYGSKSKLKILNITIDMYVYDEYLSLYYSSLQLGLDGFTVRIDNPDYTNIKGGYGIFGCYSTISHTIDFSERYLDNLGFH